MNNIRFSLKTGVVALALILVAPLAFSHAAGVSRRVRFPRGRTSTTIEWSVIRGERDRYVVRARAGQHMTVRISSLENNAVFQILRPGLKKMLPGAVATNDAMKWSGKLPASGDYTIEVGGTRGNAGYRLHIGVR